jgi:hypothetical protein
LTHHPGSLSPINEDNPLVLRSWDTMREIDWWAKRENSLIKEERFWRGDGKENSIPQQEPQWRPPLPKGPVTVSEWEQEKQFFDTVLDQEKRWQQDTKTTGSRRSWIGRTMDSLLGILILS